MLEIKNFSKSYNGSDFAIRDLNLTVCDGEIYGFIGHNGAGKSTTIKCIVGALDFSQGEILLDGVSIKDNPVEFKKKIAFVPDNPELYEFMTGKKYIDFIADIYQVNKKERVELIKKYATALELEDALGDYISSYSHGMKQKLALISALVHSPKLLVLDEPFVGLDPRASFNLKNIMRELTNNGVQIFFSTHVLEVAEKLCDKIAIIKDGKLITCGLTEEVTKDASLEEVFLSLGDNENIETNEGN